MTPREIQMRIRAGASVEEIVEASGMPAARVEAFAAPVIAERNHIAGLAQTGSVRRTGEATGHRTLRAALAERVKTRGVDPDSVEWDSFKMDDGRWSVSAGYRIEQADRIAVFYFDQRGRFSVPGNDEARWAVGEQTETGKSASPSVEDADTEPTLKLAGPADELALLRAVETDEADPEAETEPEPALESEPDNDLATTPEAEPVPAEDAPAQVDTVAVPDDLPAPEPDVPEVPEAEVPEEPSQLDLLYDLLGSDGYAEDSIRVFEGLTDAAAVPDVADSAWQESEPEPEEPAADADQPRIFADGATQETLPGAEHETPPEAATAAAPEPEPEPEPASADTQLRDVDTEPRVETEAEPVSEGVSSEEPEPEPEPQPKPAAKAKKRKRASVPSWDEIMFGSPAPKGK
jgi:hypothetical protein